MRESEQKARDLLRVAGLTMQMARYLFFAGCAYLLISCFSATLTDGEPSQCRFCRYDCYLSSVTCSCSPNSVACLKHAEQISSVTRCDLSVIGVSVFIYSIF